MARALGTMFERERALSCDELVVGMGFSGLVTKLDARSFFMVNSR